MIYLAIDGGTTNTRIHLMKDGIRVDTVKFAIGAKAGREALSACIKEGIELLLTRNKRSEQDVCRVLAAGMITSELGLCALPHIPTPAGLEELHDAMANAEFPEITSIPFTFIRGVKCVGEAPDTTDMMRGEEAEVMGLLGEQPAGVYILPGSHSKIVEVDAEGRIVDFSTMLTGEMMAALSGHTILSDAVDLKDSSLLAESLLEGYRVCDRLGLNAALFKTRIAKNLFSHDKDACYSFFCGAVLHDEIESICRRAPSRVILGGNSHLKSAMELLLRAEGLSVVTVPDDEVEACNAKGMIRIFEYAE